MLIALSVRNKLGFIDGSILEPTGEMRPLWIRNNHMVIAWILNSVSKGISSSILFTNSAQEIWTDLKDRFQKGNGPRIFHLKGGIATLKQGNESVNSYFSKLKSLWDEYVSYRPGCTCGNCTCEGVKSMELFVQMEYLMSFLMGLDEKYGHSRSHDLAHGSTSIDK